jgi:hypothetical protein
VCCPACPPVRPAAARDTATSQLWIHAPCPPAKSRLLTEQLPDWGCLLCCTAAGLSFCRHSAKLCEPLIGGRLGAVRTLVHPCARAYVCGRARACARSATIGWGCCLQDSASCSGARGCATTAPHSASWTSRRRRCPSRPKRACTAPASSSPRAELWVD